eukprot:3324127-Amphidinium_carterae.3
MSKARNKTKCPSFELKRGARRFQMLSLRPDSSGIAALLASCQWTRPLVKNLVEAQRVLEHLHATKALGLRYFAVHPAHAGVVAIAGSSPSTAPDAHAQGGFLVSLTSSELLRHEQCVVNGNLSLVAWRSATIERICSSSIAADS